MEENQQNTNPPQSPQQPAMNRGKVIQPSESFVAEMKAAQPASSPAPAPSAPQDMPQTTPPAVAQLPVRPVAPSSAIYPDPTSGINASNPTSPPPASTDDSQAAGAKSSSKILIVRIVAGGMILLNAINGYNWLANSHAGFVSWPSLIGIGLGLILAIGIFLLKEAARVTYVFLSMLLLVLSAIGIITFFASTHNSTSFQANTQPISKSKLEQDITYAEQNRALTPAQRQVVIQQLQKQIDNTSSNPVEQNIRQYISTGLSVVTAILPLIVLTRPSIKQVFR